MTEADTCREFVTPRLVEAGWGAAESVIGEQHSFTNGRIIVAGGKVRRGKQRRFALLTRVFLRPTQDGLGI
jgi:type I restriction enzyme, R subunit